MWPSGNCVSIKAASDDGGKKIFELSLSFAPFFLFFLSPFLLFFSLPFFSFV
jgi:hypothetical protein